MNKFTDHTSPAQWLGRLAQSKKFPLYKPDNLSLASQYSCRSQAQWILSVSLAHQGRQNQVVLWSSLASQCQWDLVYKTKMGAGETVYWVKALAMQAWRPEFKSPEPRRATCWAWASAVLFSFREMGGRKRKIWNFFRDSQPSTQSSQQQRDTTTLRKMEW